MTETELAELLRTNPDLTLTDNGGGKTESAALIVNPHSRNRSTQQGISMSSEIRRVPKDWKHPINEVCRHWGNNPHDGRPCYMPLYDNDYETAAQEWESEYKEFMAMTPDERIAKFGYDVGVHYWEYDPPPNEQYYRSRKWTAAEATCYQIYETISEGTPTSPVFETLDALTEWLVSQGYSRVAAERFARSGYAPSAVFVKNADGFGEFASGIKALSLL